MNIENLKLLISGLNYLQELGKLPEEKIPTGEEILIALDSFSLPKEFWAKCLSQDFGFERELFKEWFDISDEEYDILCPDVPEKSYEIFISNVQKLKLVSDNIPKVVINLSEVIEKNNKPVWFNNAKILHTIPLGTELNCEGKLFYVCRHTRDCDLTPLYSICDNWEFIRYCDLSYEEIIKDKFFKKHGRHLKTFEEYFEMESDISSQVNYDSGLMEETIRKLMVTE